MHKLSNRRRFIKACASFAAAVGASPTVLATREQPANYYSTSMLVDVQGNPIKAAQLLPRVAYLFHYPYKTTPCFLLNLGDTKVEETELNTQDGKRYIWEGGVGPQHSIVAFSAICAHKMSHPTKTVSFINFHAKPTKFINKLNQQSEQRGDVVFCCSERSIYDVKRGAQVISGPAPQPLATILLEHDPATDALYAKGTLGGEMFEKFFSKFSHRIALEYRIANAKQTSEITTVLQKLEDFSSTQMMC